MFSIDIYIILYMCLGLLYREFFETMIPTFVLVLVALGTLICDRHAALFLYIIVLLMNLDYQNSPMQKKRVFSIFLQLFFSRHEKKIEKIAFFTYREKLITLDYQNAPTSTHIHPQH